MTQRLRRKETQALTRNRLLDVATRRFAEHGFAAVSVDAVAEEVGLTKGAVYANFATKEDLFLAVLDEQMNQQDTLLASLFTDPNQFQLQALQLYLKTLFAQSQQWRLLVTEFWLYAARHPERREQLAQRYQQRRVHLAQFLTHYFSQEGRQPPLDVHTLASVLIALSNGLEMQHVLDVHALPDDLLATTVLLFLQSCFPASTIPLSSPRNGKE